MNVFALLLGSDRPSAVRWLLVGTLGFLALLTLLEVLPWQVALAVAALAFAAAIVFSTGRFATKARKEADPVSTNGFAGLSVDHLAEALADPLIIVDANGAIVLANAAARAAFGDFRPGTLLQLRFRTPEFQAFVARLLSDEAGPQMTEYAERVPIERWYRVVGRPAGDGSGLSVLVFKDQSEVRRIDRMRSDFIANASHELRTPLASIAGFIETLRGPARGDAKAREHFLQIMHEQTGRMARLIDDLLSLSRLEMKTYANPSDSIDLTNLVGGVIDALRHLAEEVGVEIVREGADGPVPVLGQRDELIQVFENLLENACKYGQTGGRVVVTVDAGDGVADGPSVTVRDFGPGISEEHIPRLTERFYRVDVETSRAQKGTGLGLAIVKHILTRHNARLTIRSELNEGTSFTVHFAPR